MALLKSLGTCSLLTVGATPSPTLNLSGHALLFAVVPKNTDTVQVPAPDLPYSQHPTALGTYTNCEAFAIAKKRIIPGQPIVWHYLMVERVEPIKLSLPPSYLVSPAKKPRRRVPVAAATSAAVTAAPTSISPVSPQKSSYNTTIGSRNLVGKVAKAVFDSAVAKQNAGFRPNKTPIPHFCAHFTVCREGKCQTCKCVKCLTCQPTGKRIRIATQFEDD